MSLLAPETIDLTSLPFVHVEDWRMLPAITGIYFVVDDEDVVVYIGQAVSLKKRLGSHVHKQTFLAFKRGRIVWVAVPYEELSPIEKAMIAFFKPSMNVALGGNARPKTEAASYEQTTLRVAPELLEQLRGEARKIGRPLNTHIHRILEGHCARSTKERRRREPVSA